MTKLAVKKVSEAGERSLPIFSELDEVADRIREEAYRLFTGRGSGEGRALDDWLAAQRHVCWPAAELTEEDDEFKIKVALAGFEEDDISVTATPNEVIVKATQSEEEEEEDEQVHWSEFHRNDVYRRFALPADIDVSKVSASFKRGLLEVEAPRLTETD